MSTATTEPATQAFRYVQRLPIKVRPRPYQIEAVRWLLKVANGRGIIADEMGLGKTCEVYLAWRELLYPMPSLIIAGRNAQPAWLQQAKDWGCPEPVIIRGTAQQRAALWKEHRQGFVIITREALRKDIQAKSTGPSLFWRCIIVDECHKDANRKTKAYENLKKICNQATFVFLTSGSLVRRGPESIWGPLSIVAPKRFRSYWNFIERYCYLEKEGAFGWEVLGLKDAKKLQQDIMPYLLRRSKAEVRPDMPPKQRDLTSNRLVMQPKQMHMYQAILKDAMLEVTTSQELNRIIITPNMMTKIMRMRQILVTPKILDPSCREYGAGIERLIEMLDDADDRHMAIFTPFTAAIPHIYQRLIDAGYKDQQIITLRGGMEVEELQAAIRRFQMYRGIAICSIPYAESFDLTPATWAVFLGFEFDVWQNLQAEDRLHRGEIKDPVTIYYITHEGGVDEDLVKPILDQKANTVFTILKDYDSLRKLLEKNQASLAAQISKSHGGQWLS